MKKTFKWLSGTVVVILIIAILFGIVVTLFKDKLNVDSWFPQSLSIIDRKVEESLPAQANGGLTPEEVKKMREDDNRPYADDVIRDFYVYEMDNYVLLYRKAVSVTGVDKYPNLLFLKTSRGLIYEGTMGISADIPVNWWSGKHNFDKGKLNLNMNMVDYRTDFNKGFKLFFNSLSWPFNAGNSSSKENVVTFSDFNSNFASNFFNVNGVAYLTTHKNETARLRNWTIDKLSSELTQPYFMQLTDNLTTGYVHLIGGETLQENTELLNSYATHLYLSSKTADKSDNNVIVDLKNYFSYYIDNDKQVNYPIDTTKQEEYNGKTHYAMYLSNVVANVQYSYLSTKIDRDIEKSKSNSGGQFVAPLPEETIDYTLVTYKLNAKEGTDLNGSDLSTNPVIIYLNDKRVVFNTNESINKAKTIAVESNVNVDYEITSYDLMFDTYNGNFMPLGNFMNFTLDYYFNAGLIPVNISLNNLSSVDLTEVNLSNSPVLIVLSNENNTYQFNFNSNVLINEEILRLIPSGSYNYTILSNQLLFSNYSGELYVSSNNRNFVFNYGVPQSLPYFAVLGNTIFTPPSTNALYVNFTNNTNVNLSMVTLTVYSVDLDVVFVKEKSLYIYETGDGLSVTILNNELQHGHEYSFQLQLKYGDKSLTTNLLTAYWSSNGRVFDLKLNNK